MKISSKLLFISINKFPTAGKYYTGKAQLALKNWKNLFGDQREDSLTSLEVCYLLKMKYLLALNIILFHLRVTLTDDPYSQKCVSSIRLFYLSLWIWGRLHKTWAHGANHRDSSIKVGRKAQIVYEIDP